MNIDEAYNSWANQYDSMANKTRDLEKLAAQQTLSNYTYNAVLELGCGTGKNTSWLLENATELIGLDFSTEMLEKAKEKITSNKVSFQQADLNEQWNVPDSFASLITCSLTLEHIQNLDFIFNQAALKLKTTGKFFICELHPFKQYNGSQAKFEVDGTLIKLNVFTHHISDYTNAAKNNGLKLIEVNEWFDKGNENEIPRLISFVFEK